MYIILKIHLIGRGGISMNSGKGATAEVVKKILSLLPGVDC